MEGLSMWIQDAIHSINTEQIVHRNWTNALSESIANVLASAPGEVLSITGPSRVGKTRLISELTTRLIGEKEVLEDGSRPIIKVQAENSVKNNFFDSKDFYIRMLEAIKHPFYGVNAPNDPLGVERYKKLERVSEGTLRRALEIAIEYCHSQYIVIDEVQHVLRFYGGLNAAAAFLNSLKSLAQAKGVILVLVGAYPILDALKLSPHMLGREHLVHFPRYRETREDIKVFNQILSFYSQFLRFPSGIESLHPWNEFLLYGSLGCIGLLGRWIRAALANTWARGDDVLDLYHFEETIRSEEKTREIEEEILIGEQALRKPSAGKREINSEKIIEKVTIKEKSKKKSNKKPFQRNPKRMPIAGRA
jgi:hypothetical protein